MFTRALEYLQQEVEERKWPSPLSAQPPCLLLLSAALPGQGACFLVILIVPFRSGRFQREWRSKLPDHADLGSGGGERLHRPVPPSSGGLLSMHED